MIAFEVHGRPAVQGSKVIRRTDAGPKLADDRPGPVRERRVEWRHAVARAAFDAVVAAGRTTPLQGPVRVELVFRFHRPASMRPGLRWHSKELPVLALAGLVEGALVSSAVIGSGAQVSDLAVSKVWCVPGEAEGVSVSVVPLSHSGPLFDSVTGAVGGARADRRTAPLP